MIKVLTAAVALVAVAGAAQAADRYMVVGRTKTGDRVLSVSVDRISGGAEKTAWLLWVGREPEVDYALETAVYRCADHTVRYGPSTAYGPDGKVVDSRPAEATFEPAVPGTLGETAGRYVCDGVVPPLGRLVAPDLSSAVAGARTVLAPE